MDLLVAYDIADTQGSGGKRLRAVHDLCCGYGTRVQFSVFECRLTPARYAALTSELESIIDAQKDCVNIYHLGRPLPECKTVLGTPSRREVGDALDTLSSVYSLLVCACLHIRSRFASTANESGIPGLAVPPRQRRAR